MFFTYRDESPGNPSNPNRYSGSLAAYVATYLGYQPPSATIVQTAAVAQCPASIRVLPSILPSPPLNVPISYFSQSRLTNDSGFFARLVHHPFGRPTKDAALDGLRPPSRTYESPQKLAVVKRPSSNWAMTDCDRQLMASLGITSATYMNYIAVQPAHGGPKPATRQFLYYDWSVRTEKRPD
jgi:hypothetical protein